MLSLRTKPASDARFAGAEYSIRRSDFLRDLSDAKREGDQESTEQGTI
jgi:hypothetical protein